MKYGEIVQLGRHRLMYGDATKSEDVHRLVGGERVDLVLTDPPYGVESVGKDGKISTGSKVYMPVIGDTCTDMAEESYRIIRGICNRQIIWGGQNFTRFLPPSCGWIFWDKCKPDNNGLSFSDGELAWSNFGTKLKKYAFMWNGFCRGGNPELNRKIHPNQKPVELHTQILNDFTHEGDTILDCFGGSGTTLIACEITNRTCYMMELSPEYCDVIIDRYEKLAHSSAQA